MLRTLKRLGIVPVKFDPLAIADYNEHTRFTPDVHLLETKDCCKLFVCDNLMQGHPEHELLGHNIRLVPAAYTVDPFTLWTKKLGLASYAVPLREPTFSKTNLLSPADRGVATRIRGSLHIVRPYQFTDVLDRHYQNGIEFERVRVQITWPYRERHWDIVDQTTFSAEKIGITEAYMYVGVREFWDQIEHHELKPVRLCQPRDSNRPPYYLMTPQEYLDK